MAAVLPTPTDAFRPAAAAAPGGPADTGWRAGLKLDYAFNNGKSLLRRQERHGPLFVQKPFYPEGPATCHTYILHPPGGVVGGDRLCLEVTLAAESQALITTPAAGKFYRSAGPAAVQINRLEIGAHAVLEWLPQETIIYSGAVAEMRTMVRLAERARFIGWEMICLGLPACAQPFAKGCIHQQLEIWREDKPLLIEPLRIASGDALLTDRWGLAGRPVVGTMVATGNDPQLVADIRRQVSPAPDIGLFAATRVQGLIVCRFLGDDVYAGLKLFRRAWEVLRPAVAGREACAPRIWAT
jgi:urease accessory protein